MNREQAVFVLETEGEIDEDFGQGLEAATGSELRTVKKHGLAGDVSTWLLIGNFAVTSLAAIVPLITSYLKERRVKSIKLGDLVIENPTPEQVEFVINRIREQK